METVREFAAAEIAPRVRAMDDNGRYDDDLLPKFFDMGLMGVDVPETYGGSGGTFFQSILAVEEISRVDPAVGVLVDVQNTLFNNALALHATASQRDRWLRRSATDTVVSYALSEAGSGSDAFALACRAEDRGDHYELTGKKLWITNAGEAELFIVMANLDPSKGYKGITSFLVERTFPGFTVGKKEDKWFSRFRPPPLLPGTRFEVGIPIPSYCCCGCPGGITLDVALCCVVARHLLRFAT